MGTRSDEFDKLRVKYNTKSSAEEISRHSTPYYKIFHRMKILLTGLSYKPHLGGIENSFFHIAKVYKELGHKVIILVGDKTLSGKGRLPEKEIIDDVNVYRFNRYKTEFSVFKSLIGFLIYQKLFLCKKIK